MATHRLASLTHWLHAHIVASMLTIYALAAVWPGPGLWLRDIGVASFPLPKLLLGLLLFNAGMAVDVRQLAALRRRPGILVAGLALNACIPLALTLMAAWALRLWHSPDEVQNILVGFAIIGSMPIAGSSTAWAQNAEGNVALSLGLVLGSTILSPLLTPFSLRCIAAITTGDYAEDLLELAGGDTQMFLLLSIILPSCAGMLVRFLKAERWLPTPKVVNLWVLLLLNYVNAVGALPKVFSRPDWDYVALIIVCALIVCAAAFAVGRLAGAMLHAPRPELVSLVFGLGMSNNGSGMVLAASALSDHANVLLVILCYNLGQQLIAALADSTLGRRRAISTP